MTLNAFKNWVLILVSVALFASVVDRCNDRYKHAAQVTEYDNVIADLEADRLLILDSVDVLNEQLQVEREALPKRLNEYSKLPVKERIKLITKVDTLVVITDTSACLSIAGVDSVNKLTIHYQSCVVQSATKDTIITHLTNANLKADSLLTNKDKIITAAKEDAKFEKQGRKFWQGLAIGLGAFQAVIVYIAVK